MTVLPVDANRIRLMGTGNVSPSMEWIQGADGKNRPSDVQAVSEDKVPLWNVEVLRQDVVFGAEKTVPTDVTVPSATEPVVPGMAPVVMPGLVVSYYAKGGAIREYWSAEQVKAVNPGEPQAQAQKPNPAESKSN